MPGSTAAGLCSRLPTAILGLRAILALRMPRANTCFSWMMTTGPSATSWPCSLVLHAPLEPMSSPRDTTCSLATQFQSFRQTSPTATCRWAQPPRLACLKTALEIQTCSSKHQHSTALGDSPRTMESALKTTSCWPNLH